MTSLPPSWSPATLGELIGVEGLFVDGDWVESKDQDPTGEVRLTQLADVGDGEWRNRSDRRMTAEAAERLRCTYLELGDVLVARMPEPLGRACLFPGDPKPCVTVVDVAVIRPGSPSVNPAWLMWSINSPAVRARIESLQAGTTRKRISRKNLGLLELPVPPLSEQERIVSAIEEAFSKRDAGEVALRGVRQRLKRMRDAVLAAAVAGDLVSQDQSDTPAAKLLADLGVEPLDRSKLLPLPASWEWARVQDVGQVDLGRQRSPKYHRGPNMKPYLRVANVFEDRIDTSDVKEMHFEPAAFERSRLEYGDILLNEGQTPELLGRPAMYRGNPPDVAFTNSLLRFKSAGGINAEWALLVFRNHMHAGRFTRESRITTNIAHLSAARFKPVEFPVPPSSEQHRIVTEVERQFSFIEACERAVDAGLVRSSALRRSVLKAAFEGKLVPQDPSDEPASALLDGIRREREANKPVAGARPRRKKAEAS